MTAASDNLSHHPKIHIWLAAGILLLGLILLLPRTAVTPQDNDSAELAAAAVLGSLVHPPGFPIYSVLSTGLVALFPSNPFHTLAVFSAVSQALAAALLLLLGAVLQVSPWLSAAAALAWLFYEPTLRLGTDGEVFAFANLLTLLWLHVSLRFYRQPQGLKRTAILVGLTGGLAACHHTTVIFWAPFVLLLLWCRGFRARGAAGVFDATLAASLGALVGLTPYLLLLARYTHAPEYAFAPLRNGFELLGYMLRLGYGALSFHAASAVEERSYLGDYLLLTLRQTPLLLAAAAALLVALKGWFDPLRIALILTLACQFWFASQLILPDQPEIYSVFLMRFYSGITLALAVTALFCFSSWPQLNARKITTGFLAAALIIPALWHLPSSLQGADTGSRREVAHTVHQILTGLPPQAVFITNTDRIAFALAYEQRVLRKRPDVTVVIQGMLLSRFYRDRIKQRFPFWDSTNNSLTALVQKLLEHGIWVGALAETAPPDVIQAAPGPDPIRWTQKTRPASAAHQPC